MSPLLFASLTGRWATTRPDSIAFADQSAESPDPDIEPVDEYDLGVRFHELVGADERPDHATVAHRTPVVTDTYLNRLNDDPRNNGFVSALVDRRRARRMNTSRRGFLRGTIAAAAATTAASTVSLFGPARRVEAQSGVIGAYPRRILQYCPPYNSGDNCQPGCGSSPICTDCCTSDGYFRNDPANGYSLYAGGCGDGDIADGWLWRYSGKCGSCAEIEYRCSDGYIQTDTGPAPFICRYVTDCVPLADGEAPGPALPDAARDTNWRPAGALEVAVDNGSSVSINGWIADGSGVPITMRIRSNNSIVHFGTAALPRPDVASRVRGAGPNTGFAVSFPVEPGRYEFCVDALAGVLTATVGCVTMNVGSGGSVRGPGSTGTISPPPPPPAATVPPGAATPTPAPSAEPTPTPEPGEIVLPGPGPESASPTYGAVQVIRRSGPTTGFVSGWAGDPDTDDGAFIDVLVDGESVVTTRTDLPRPDVARAFEQLNGRTGFAVGFPLPEAPAEVCVVAVSPDDGRRRPLGCRALGASGDQTESAPPARPTATGPTAAGAAVVYGALDDVEIEPAGLVVRGWAFDPNDRDRTIEITVQVGSVIAQGETGVENTAAQQRYGIDAACGYELDLAPAPGTQDLVVTALATDGNPIVIGQQTISTT